MGDRRATVPPMQKTCNLRRKFFCARFRTYFSKFRLCLVPQLFFSNSRHILLPTCISFNPENPFWSSLEAVELACFEFSAFRLPYWPTCEISLNSHVTNAMLYTRVDIVNKHRVLRFYIDIVRNKSWQRFFISYAGLINTTDVICVVNAYTFT